LANDLIAEVASSQIIYSAIASSSAFEQAPTESATMMDAAYLDLDVEVVKPYVTSNEVLTFNISLSNLGRRPAIAVRIDEIIPEGFEIAGSPYPVSNSQSLRLNIRTESNTTKKFSISDRSTS